MRRTTTEIIDQAIHENRGWEILIYIFAGVFVAIGTSLIIWSLIRKEPIVGILGIAESVLFVPAMNAATRTRRANIMLRLLELRLRKSRSSVEAGEMLQRVFESHFNETPHNKIVSKKPVAEISSD